MIYIFKAIITWEISYLICNEREGYNSFSYVVVKYGHPIRDNLLPVNQGSWSYMPVQSYNLPDLWKSSGDLMIAAAFHIR